MVQVLRELTDEDVQILQDRGSIGAKTPPLAKLRSAHHQLAQHIALGKSHIEASLITGYSQSRISILLQDPAFTDLVANYRANSELRFVDVLKRMENIGLTSLEELQERLDTDPDSFSKRELADLVELGLLKGRAFPGASSGPTGPTGSGVPAVTMNIKFVSAKAEATSRTVIDVEGEE